MDITPENYEIWAINYLEGDMDPSEVAVFMAFLVDNPGIADEIESLKYSKSKIDPKVKNTNFAFLKKTYKPEYIKKDTFEDFCIAFHEGDLDRDTEKKHIAYIGDDSARKKVFDIYGKLKPVPDPSIFFPDRELLIREELPKSGNRINRLLYYSSSAAAILLLSILLWYSRLSPYKESFVSEKYDALNDYKTIYSSVTANTDVSVTSKDNTPFMSDIVSPKKMSAKKSLSVKLSVKEALDSNFREITPICLIRIEASVTSSNKTVSNTSTLHKSNFYRSTPNTKITNSTISSLQRTGSVFFAKVRNITLNNILQRSVEGLNQLAEADLEYKSETDENGRIIEFALSSERFNIKRKINNN